MPHDLLTANSFLQSRGLIRDVAELYKVTIQEPVHVSRKSGRLGYGYSTWDGKTQTFSWYRLRKWRFFNYDSHTDKYDYVAKGRNGFFGLNVVIPKKQWLQMKLPKSKDNSVLVITEGELDALSVFQGTHEFASLGNKDPYPSSRDPANHYFPISIGNGGYENFSSCDLSFCLDVQLNLFSSCLSVSLPAENFFLFFPPCHTVLVDLYNNIILISKLLMTFIFCSSTGMERQGEEHTDRDRHRWRESERERER